jgi:hypothetical protein
LDEDTEIKAVSPNGKFIVMQFGNLESNEVDQIIVKIIKTKSKVRAIQYAFKSVMKVKQADMLHEFHKVNRITSSIDNFGLMHTFISGYLMEDTYDSSGAPRNPDNFLVLRYYVNGES